MLLPICHYTQLPVCGAKKQKRHPSWCSVLDNPACKAAACVCVTDNFSVSVFLGLCVFLMRLFVVLLSLCAQRQIKSAWQSTSACTTIITSIITHLEWAYKLWCELWEVYSNYYHLHKLSDSLKCESKNVYRNTPNVSQNLNTRAYWLNYLNALMMLISRTAKMSTQLSDPATQEPKMKATSGCGGNTKV